MGMLRTERILLAPKEWRIGRAQTPQGTPCQRPTPGASRSWGVLVPSGYGGSESPTELGTGKQAPHPREAPAQLAWPEPLMSSVSSCAS